MILKSKLFFGAVILFFFLIATLYMANKKSFEPKRIGFQENCFSLELADTVKKRVQGLMFRKELAEDKGMLFVFPKQGVYSFWMENTLISLDIIWLSQENEVVFIKHNALPCKIETCKNIKPDVFAKYVLEINAGLAKEMDLKIGDKFSFEF